MVQEDGSGARSMDDENLCTHMIMLTTPAFSQPQPPTPVMCRFGSPCHHLSHVLIWAHLHVALWSDCGQSQFQSGGDDAHGVHFMHFHVHAFHMTNP